MTVHVRNIVNELDRLTDVRSFGRVVAVQGLLVQVGGIQTSVSVGDRVIIHARDSRKLPCEVVGFREGRALLLPFGGLGGVALGARAEVEDAEPAIYPTLAWQGRVINAMGEAVDDKGPLPAGDVPYAIRNTPPPAAMRQPGWRQAGCRYPRH